MAALQETDQSHQTRKRPRTGTDATGWQKAHNAFKASMSLATEQLAEPNLQAGTREADLVKIAVASECQSGSTESTPSTDSIPSNIFIDVSQSVSRKPWANITKRSLPSITTSTVFYWVNGQRTVLPLEHFLLLGWTKPPKVAELRSSHLKDLSGEAMPLPCIAVVIISLMHNLSELWSTDN